MSELRVRQQRLTARYRARRIERTAARNQIPEWVRNSTRQESVGCGIRRRIVADELARNKIQILADREIVAIGADEVRFNDDLAGQFALNAKHEAREFRILPQ